VGYYLEVSCTTLYPNVERMSALLLQWEENRVKIRNGQMPQKIQPKMIEEYHYFLFSQQAWITI